MSNPSFPYLLKIGKTTRTTIERAKEISSSSGVPTPFKIDYEIMTPSLDVGGDAIQIIQMIPDITGDCFNLIVNVLVVNTE